MATANEQKLIIAEGQRQLFFERMQQIFDLSRNLSDPDDLDNFLCSCETVDDIRNNFQQCIAVVNSLLLKIDSKSKPDFNQWLAFEDLYCRVKRKQAQVDKPSSSFKSSNVNNTDVIT